MSGDSCDRKTIYSLAFNDRCDFVKQVCTDNVNVINLDIIYFCQLDQNWFVAFILGLYLIILCFRVIGIVSEEYLSISLGNISKRLGLSEALTGVTLLAYANGSPDIISSLVAGDQDGGALLSVGALYGASLFTCNFVFASVLHSAPDKRNFLLPKNLFMRDIAIFGLSTFSLMMLSFMGFSSLFVGLLLMSVYIIYVLSVGINEYYDKKYRDLLAVSL